MTEGKLNATETQATNPVERNLSPLAEELKGLIGNPEGVKSLSKETKSFLREHDCFTDENETELRYEVVQANDLIYLVDPLHPKLKEGEEAVYRFHDEAADLRRIARGLGEKFETVIDAFRGGGHSTLPILLDKIAKKGKSIDINPRATPPV